MALGQLRAAGEILLRRAKRKAQQVTPTNEEIRRLLPLARGGKPSQKVRSFDPSPATPLQKVTIPAAPAPSIGSQFKASAGLRPMRVVEEVNDMNTEDIVREMVNDPMITITSEMLPIINDPRIMMDPSGNLVENRFAEQFSFAATAPTSKRKRKVSKYQKELGRQLKRLKKKHPRTPINRLMKKAHAATRKALK